MKGCERKGGRRVQADVKGCERRGGRRRGKRGVCKGEVKVERERELCKG